MKYFIDLFGCVKNQVDAENMMASLNEAGWTPTEDPEQCDLIIVNSCGFIESAKQESINAVLFHRRQHPTKKILLAGCLSQRYSKELKDDLPEADCFFGIDDLDGIAAAAGRALGARPLPASGAGAGYTGSTGNSPPLSLPGSKSGSRPLLSLPGTAYVKISEGCNNNCSYCAIPLIRGPLKSRSIDNIVLECKTLLERGIKELCLIGQDTGSFGRDLQDTGAQKPDLSKGDLPLLLKSLSRLEGEFRIRLLYLHPDNFPIEILDIMEKDKRILPYFDLPFQHASEKILRAMNRRGSAEKYLELIAHIRSKFEDAALRSTFLTGFPGESEDDFRLLLDFQERAKLDWLGCFAYSREDNTPAYNMKGRVSKKLAEERKKIIEERQVPITEKQMDRFIGRNFDVLVEERIPPPEGEDDCTLYLGRIASQAPDVDGSTVITEYPVHLRIESGFLLPCKITGRAGFDLKAEISG